MNDKQATQKRIEYQEAGRDRLDEIKKELETADDATRARLLKEAWELYQWYPGRGY